MPAKFIKSAVRPEDFPATRWPEVAVVGRSNAGKSTLLNAFAQQKIAHVGQTPGKTRLVNFFLLDDKYALVDLPGYGYAAVPEKERRMWRRMVEGYLKERPNLAGAILVIDAKRTWSEDEENLREWLKVQGIPLFIALSKIDKLNQSDLAQRRREYDELGLADCLYFVSGRTGKGVDKLRQAVYKRICDFLV